MWTKVEYPDYALYKLVAASDGTLYEFSEFGEPNQILTPVSRLYKLENREYTDIALQPGHKVDHLAPYRCSQCGTDRLQVIHTGDYETSARCPGCGITDIVHDG